MVVPMTLSDIEEYSLRSIAVLGGNMHSQITMGNISLPKAALSTVKIFTVHVRGKNQDIFGNFQLKQAL